MFILCDGTKTFYRAEFRFFSNGDGKSRAFLQIGRKTFQISKTAGQADPVFPDSLSHIRRRPLIHDADCFGAFLQRFFHCGAYQTDRDFLRIGNSKDQVATGNRKRGAIFLCKNTELFSERFGSCPTN